MQNVRGWMSPAPQAAGVHGAAAIKEGLYSLIFSFSNHILLEQRDLAELSRPQPVTGSKQGEEGGAGSPAVKHSRGGLGWGVRSHQNPPPKALSVHHPTARASKRPHQTRSSGRFPGGISQQVVHSLLALGGPPCTHTRAWPVGVHPLPGTRCPRARQLQKPAGFTLGWRHAEPSCHRCRAGISPSQSSTAVPPCWALGGTISRCPSPPQRGLHILG